jgi:hypothetical protein
MALALSGCTPPNEVKVVRIDEPTASAEPTPLGTIVPVTAASWDPARHPDRVRQEDFIQKVATEYTVWAPGKSWRVTGDGWEPGEEIALLVEHGGKKAGGVSQVRADAVGQFVTAFKLPAGTAPGQDYTITAVGRGGFSDNQPLTVVDPD